MSETAQALVDQMVAAGEWPEPKLLDTILAQGEQAVEPLRTVLRQEVHGWPEEAPLDHAIHLLGALQAAAAMPELIELFRRYEGEPVESAVQALGAIGTPAVEPALAIARDPTVCGRERSAAVSAAILAAGDNPDLRAVSAATARELLANCLARVAELDEQAGEEEDLAEEDEPDDAEANDVEDVSEQEDWDDEELEEEDWDDEETAEDDELSMVTPLVIDLAQLADPQGRDLIHEAHEAEIVDRWFIGPEDVDEMYREASRRPKQPDPRAWLEQYRRNYQAHLAKERHIARDQLRAAPAFKSPSALGPSRKVGRNDPCWCGSGKKYKHCHWRQDRG
jgi:hypothetical protein